MERNEKVVVDASVAIKWFNKEEYSEIADHLKMQHIRGELALAAPVLPVLEVANALRYSPDLGTNDVKNSIKDLLDLQITLHCPDKSWTEEAVETAFAYGITIYDASYMALPLKLKIPAYTADEKLLEKAKDPLLRHIFTLQPPTNRTRV